MPKHGDVEVVACTNIAYDEALITKSEEFTVLSIGYYQDFRFSGLPQLRGTDT
jgi:hypothetical protein